MTATPDKNTSIGDALRLLRHTPGSVFAPVDQPEPKRRARSARKPRPARRVSALTTLPMLAAHPGTIRVVGGARGELNARLGPVPTGDGEVARELTIRELTAPAPKLFESPARPAVRGAEAIEARFAKVGVQFELTPDAAYLNVITEAGAMPREANAAMALREAIQAAASLILATRRGQPLTCAWCDEVATDVGLLGAPMCEAHATEAVTPMPVPPPAGLGSARRRRVF